MKFRKGQEKIKVPPIGELIDAVLVIGDMEVRLSVVNMEQLHEHRMRYNQDERAWPVMAALARGAPEVHIWPTPHKGGTIKLRYYPPIQEI